jgi:WD40 repeat protein
MPLATIMAKIDSAQVRKLKVFISYSRRDLAVADGLVTQLESQNIEVLIDRRDLPYGEEWQNELADFIRLSDTVVWLVSPDSVESRWVNWELGEVGRLSKRLIPIRIREIDPASLPESLGKIHLLPADCLFDFGQHLSVLVDVLNTDTAWLKEATRLADRARQWNLKAKDEGLLLRSGALADAESWARSKPSVAPAISGEILDLIMNSRRATIKRQRQFVVGALAIAVVGLGLAIFSWHQRNTALANQSTYLAKLSRDQTAIGDAGTGLLLAVSGLPEWRQALDRPLVPDVARALYGAFFSIREAKILAGHTADVNTVRYSSDDQRILTSSDDGTARLWNAATGALLRTLGPHPGKVFGAEFSPDNQMIATWSEDNNIFIWDFAGRRRNSLSGHTDRVSALKFDTIAGILISASRDSTARIWHLGNSGATAVLRGHKGTVNSAAFSPDSKRAVTSSDDTSAIVWNVESAEAEVRLLGHKAAVLGAVFDSTGSKVATFSEDQTARIWDATSGQLLVTLSGHGGPISSIAFCPLGDCLVTGGRDGIARIWNAQSGKLRSELKGHTQPIMKVSITSSGKLAATASRDGSVRLWELETGSKLLTLGGHTGDIFDVAFGHNDESLVTASRDRTARTWRVPAPTTTTSRINLRTAFRSIDLTRDGKFLALGTSDGSVRLVERGLQRQIADARMGKEAVSLLAFDHAGLRLLAGAADGTISVYSVPSLDPVYRSSTDGSEIGGGVFDESGPGFSITTVAGTKAVFDGKELHLGRDYSSATGSTALVTTFSPGLDRVIIGELSGAAQIIDAQTGQRLVELKGHRGAILQSVFDSTGRKVVTASEDGTARLWDAATGSTLQVFSGHEAPVTFAAIADDGNYVATASTDRTVRLWKLGEQAAAAVYHGHLANVELVRFTHDGSGLISASHDGEVHGWDFDDNYFTMLQLAKAAAPRCLSKQQLERFGLAFNPPSWCEKADLAAASAARTSVPPDVVSEARK